MPVENIHRIGSLMFNKTPEGGVLADCVYSLLGDIHSDDEFNQEDFDLIKSKDKSVTKHWRYLTEAQAKAKLKERDELEALAAEAEEMREDVEELEEVKSDSKTAPNVAANTEGE